jgi:hypothetical protein
MATLVIRAFPRLFTRIDEFQEGAYLTSGEHRMKTLVIAVVIAAFSATIVLPSLTGHDTAYAATKKKDKKKP